MLDLVALDTGAVTGIDDGIAPPVAAVYAMPGEAWVAVVSQSGCMTPIPAVVGLRVRGGAPCTMSGRTAASSKRGPRAAN